MRKKVSILILYVMVSCAISGASEQEVTSVRLVYPVAVDNPVNCFQSDGCLPRTTDSPKNLEILNKRRERFSQLFTDLAARSKSQKIGKSRIEENSIYTDDEGELNDILEATFRYQLKKSRVHSRADSKVIFLKLAGADPEDVFMTRFTDLKLFVKKVSMSRSNEYGVTDLVTGKMGIIYRVDGVYLRLDSEVEVKGGYFQDGLSASGNHYILKRTNGKWVVVSDLLDWIS